MINESIQELGITIINIYVRVNFYQLAQSKWMKDWLNWKEKENIQQQPLENSVPHSWQLVDKWPKKKKKKSARVAL